MSVKVKSVQTGVSDGRVFLRIEPREGGDLHDFTLDIDAKNARELARQLVHHAEYLEKAAKKPENT